MFFKRTGSLKKVSFKSIYLKCFSWIVWLFYMYSSFSSLKELRYNLKIVCQEQIFGILYSSKSVKLQQCFAIENLTILHSFLKKITEDLQRRLPPWKDNCLWKNNLGWCDSLVILHILSLLSLKRAERWLKTSTPRIDFWNPLLSKIYMYLKNIHITNDYAALFLVSSEDFRSLLRVNSVIVENQK